MLPSRGFDNEAHVTTKTGADFLRGPYNLSTQNDLRVFGEIGPEKRASLPPNMGMANRALPVKTMLSILWRSRTLAVKNFNESIMISDFEIAHRPDDTVRTQRPGCGHGQFKEGCPATPFLQ